MAGLAKLIGVFTASLLLLAGCDERETGPVRVSAIGGAPRIVNSNREPMDPPGAFLMEAAAQGLVRLDAAGEIEPALAQRWTVSDDGLRYTFRLARTQWSNGEQVTAEQVVARLRAAAGRSSRNPFKPLLGAIAEIVAMTDEVLEISLVSPRPNFLQLLAQPEMAIIRNGAGSGPFRLAPAEDGAVSLTLPREEDEENAHPPPVLLRGEPAAAAAARFQAGQADLVVGGTAGNLPFSRAAQPAAAALVFDPVAGLFGLSFAVAEGPLGRAEVRQALSMAVDRAAIVRAIGIATLQPRESLLPPGITELPQPAAPAWAATLPERRAAAAATLSAIEGEKPLALRVAMPEGPGYRLIFAYLRRDWAAIGVDARAVAPSEAADLRFMDEVSPINLASWYLRHFTCDASRICDAAADEMLAAARIAPAPANRRALLANADRILTDAAVFIPIAAPVRWSLVSPRLTGFRPNPFGRHPAGELIRPEP